MKKILTKLSFAIFAIIIFIPICHAKYETEVSFPRIELDVQPRFYITFEANGGTLDDMTTSENYIVNGTSVKKIIELNSIIGTLPTGSKDGCNSIEWYTDEELTTKITEDSLYTYTNDITLYAKYSSLYLVHNEEEFDTALESVKTNNGGIIVFANDVTLTSTKEIADIDNLIINLGGYTISASVGSDSEISGLFKLTGTNNVKIMNGTIINDLSDTHSSYLYANAFHPIYITSDGVVDLEDLSIRGVNVPVRSESPGTVNITNCRLTSTSWAGVNNASSGIMNIYDSTIIGVNIGINNTDGGSTITGKTNVYNTTASGTESVKGTGTTIYSGSFSTDPSAFLAEGSIATLNSDTNYYNVKEVTTYSITYNLDGGVFTETPKTSITEYESYILPTPTKTGYVFAGWYSESTFDNLIATISAGTTENIEIFAKWEEASINVTKVSSQEELVDALNNTSDGTIELTSNIDVGSTGLTISSGDNIIIKLGDYNITSTTLSSSRALLNISGNANVTITSDNGELQSNMMGVYNTSTGTVILDVYKTSTVDDVAVRNASTGTIIINNSTIYCSKWAGVNNNNNGTVIITNSNITGGNAAIRNNGTSGTVTINSGTFSISGNGTLQTLIGTRGVTIYTGNFQNVDTSYSSYIATGHSYTTTIEIDSNTYYVVE